MSATVSSSNDALSRAKAQAGYPAGSIGFDWMMIALSALFLTGLWVDGWAHFHGQVDGSFFTPWHFLFYSSFALVALFLGANQFRNTGKGYAFRRALPKGYWLSLIGAVIFALGGVGDLIWHTLFGIEAGTEALMSPTHLMLAIGMALVFTGPVRSIWFRFRDRTQAARGWRELGPLIIGVTLVTTLLMFFSSYANPIVSPYIERGRSSMYQDFSVIGILFTATLYAGVTTLLLRRWRLPFGSYTILFGVSTAMLTVLNDVFVLVPGAVVTGLIVDVLVYRLRPSMERMAQFFTIAFIAPALYFALYFLTVSQMIRIQWSVHVWAGTIFTSGLIGLMMAFLVFAAANEEKPDEA